MNEKSERYFGWKEKDAEKQNHSPEGCCKDMMKRWF